MKVVALISGGKDSCYSMLLCQRYGHEVVALANLLPPQADTDDLDSYMYQTVGHQVIGAYAACTGLPLFRRRILGHSKEQRLVYEDTAGDEVEDLAALLAYAKQAVSGIEAVSSGAIASDYQRTRVERVCARLGLVSLAFMWHQPQGPLLQCMIDAEIRAVLVKVAAAGLRPDRHLGASLSAMLPQLQALRRTYGLNVCGEGGEYETLTLDCPLFTRGRLVLDTWQEVTVSSDSMAPVALLHPTAFHVEPKQPAAADDGGTAGGMPGGGVASLPAANIVDVPDEYFAPAQPAPVGRGAGGGANGTQVKVHATCGSAYVSLTAEVAGSAASHDTAEATAAALAAALQRIDDELAELHLSWIDSLFVHLYVPSMAHFAAANAAYARFLPAVNPPSRATVQLAGNDHVAMVVEVLLARPSVVERRVLHVQSISEWAPSCIGPYSQALAHGGLVHFAGQIPLDPGTMSLVGCGDAEAQCIRSLASCLAVAVAMRTDLPRSMLWCAVYCTEAAGCTGREAAERSVRAFLQGGLPATPAEVAGAGSESGASSDGSREESEEEDDRLDDYLVPPAMSRHWKPQLTFVTVPQLPRGALVEIQPTAWALDPNALAPSGSDSDGGTAANSSCLPAWVQRVQSSHSAWSICGASVQLSSVVSPGKFARLQAEVVEAGAGSGAVMGMGSAEVAAAERAAQEMLATLNESGFSVGEIASAKIYYPAVRAAGSSMLSISGAVRDALGGNVPPVLVPVSAVGANSAARAALVLELLAMT